MTTSNNNKSSFGSAFYVANTMEIFERLAWYGFFALSSVYMTTPVSQGGAGFTDSERGALQGIIPFFLYLLPVVTGALADRYGYKRMFVFSFSIMAPSYFLLGQADGFSSFFIAFAMVALGAACFKPVVVGTISRSTNDENRGLGFGIFYTMVNIGGFVGPLVAGYVRAVSWDAVFVMSALWIALNFIPVLFFYKEPKQTASNESLKQVLLQAQEVLGNARFAFLVFPCIVLLMLAGAQWLAYSTAFFAIFGWAIVNLLWNMAVTKSTDVWYRQRIKISNVPFALYLFLLTGFWTIYNQMFYTLPLYIRDFVDTGDLVTALNWFAPSLVNFFAVVNTDAVTETLAAALVSNVEPMALKEQLLHLKLAVPLSEVSQFLNGELGLTSQQVAAQWRDMYRQINPEYLINLNFASIVLAQVAVSLICSKFKTINVLVTGVVVFSLGLLTVILSQSFWLAGTVIVVAIVMMAFGEMITSPKSQEYVASIAPKEQAALYMGYYFVSMALGFLFAGLLSGWGYGYVAKELNRPELMWMIFAAIGLITSLGLLWFNQSVVKDAGIEVTDHVVEEV